MTIANGKMLLLNKFILFSSSLIVIFLFGIFIGSKIKIFVPKEKTSTQSSSLKLDNFIKIEEIKN